MAAHIATDTGGTRNKAGWQASACAAGARTRWYTDCVTLLAVLSAARGAPATVLAAALAVPTAAPTVAPASACARPSSVGCSPVAVVGAPPPATGSSADPNSARAATRPRILDSNLHCTLSSCSANHQQHACTTARNIPAYHFRYFHAKTSITLRSGAPKNELLVCRRLLRSVHSGWQLRQSPLSGCCKLLARAVLSPCAQAHPCARWCR